MSADDKTRANHNNMCLDVKGQDYSPNAAHIVIRNGDQFSETFVKWGDGYFLLWREFPLNLLGHIVLHELVLTQIEEKSNSD